MTRALKVKAAAAELRDVELARPGPWTVSVGDGNFTPEMLRDAADFYTASGGQAVAIKLGHVDSRFDGEPTFGSVTNVRYLEDDRGPVLKGDIVGMPGWLSAAAPTRWPNRSIEGWQNFEYDGRKYSLILSGLSFLGAVPPGVRNIKSLADLQTALAASSATRLVASAPVNDPAQPPQATVTAAGADPPSEKDPPDPAPQAAAPPKRKKEAGMPMDPAKFREALGLTDDLTNDEVMDALAEAGFHPASGDGGGESDGGTLLPPIVPSPVTAASVITLDPAQYSALRVQATRGEEAWRKLRENECDSVLAAAVKAGKFPPARLDYWKKLWAADPDGTKVTVDNLQANVIPVMASGYPGVGDETETDLVYAAMYPGSKVGA